MLAGPLPVLTTKMFPHPNEVFLSYSSLDWEFANQITDLLRSHGIALWHSHSSMLGGQQWLDQIGEALRRCDWFVILLSPNSIKSVWVARELTFALKQKRYNDTIVPIVLEVCDYEQFSWSLASYHIVDFTESFDAGCRALLRIWGIGYRPIDPAA
jgi:TIR domain-containing protein